MPEGAVDDRPDLGAMLHRLTRIVIEREEPLLGGHGITMWEYVVMSGLESGAAPTQAQLAQLVGRDATRLIPILDGLQARGLVGRSPDPNDRRNRIVTLSDAGREVLARCRSSIRVMEENLLQTLPAEDRDTLLSALVHLCAQTGALPGRTPSPPGRSGGPGE
jgi:DNA-binding MarR family transcriptional regulator